MDVAIVAAGAMGAGIAQRLATHGVRVRSLLDGRSPATLARAAAAGMQPATEAEIVECDLILSIVPPAEAEALALRLAPALHQAVRKPVYVDCNAISPQTVLRIAAHVAETGARFVDGGIIGLPPSPGGSAPVLYASGPDAPSLLVLDAHGLPVKLLAGPVGAASGLKMSYAGITKGTAALGVAMILAATRFGAEGDLLAELAVSQPQVLARLQRGIPDMLPKAYRWVAEMQEIAGFAGEDDATRQIYHGIAALFERVARDLEGDQAETAVLRAFAARTA